VAIFEGLLAIEDAPANVGEAAVVSEGAENALASPTFQADTCAATIARREWHGDVTPAFGTAKKWKVRNVAMRLAACARAACSTNRGLRRFPPKPDVDHLGNT
jgi:hypothetical protein